MCACVHVCMRAWVHACVCVRERDPAHMHVFMHVCVCVSVCVYRCVQADVTLCVCCSCMHISEIVQKY